MKETGGAVMAAKSHRKRVTTFKSFTCGDPFYSKPALYYPHEVLQEAPHVLSLEEIENPEPNADSTKSTQIGFAWLSNSLSIKYLIPLSLMISSFSRGSSRAIPREGPDHPPSERNILT